ncbi:MAG: tetratricopeptide repeat protein [Bacteroides sp.]|nr:tetratricopeptide repeat protein [Bacteroides sp.]
MKKTHSILILIIAISSLSACMQKENATNILSPQLIQAESIIYEYPDSALHILQNMQLPAPSDKLQNATWALLMTQAKYKSNVEQSDSLINIAYNYFMDKEDAQRKAMVLYYKGVLYDEKYNAEEALHYYLKAAKEIEKTEDYRLAYLIDIGIGMIYAYRDLGDYAKEYFEKANYYAVLSKYQESIASSYINLARIYTLKEQNDKAIEYYNKAIAIGKEYNLTNSLAAAMNETRILYIRKKDYEKALYMIREAMKIKETDQNKFALGDTYRYLQQNDSACYYLSQASESSNIYTASCAYQALYYIYKEKKDYKKTVEYSEKLWLYQDSIRKTERNKALIEMQEKYNQQKIINEKNLLKIEKDRTVRNALIALSILLVIIIITIYCYQRKVFCQKQELSEKEEKIRSFMLRLYDNEKTISRNQIRMEELTAQMEDNKGVQELWEEQQKTLQEMQQQNEALKQENQELQKNIGDYSLSLNEKSRELNMLSHLSEENKYLHQREAFLCNQLIKKTELFNKIRTMKYIDDALWKDIKENVNLLFKDYTNRLHHQIPSLTESDIQICCLIKLRFSNRDIANILAISSTSVSKRKLRLKDRILQGIGSLGENQSLDLWLMEY